MAVAASNLAPGLASNAAMTKDGQFGGATNETWLTGWIMRQRKTLK